MKNDNRNIILLCPLCGNDQFESLDVEEGEELKASDTIRFMCSDCKSVYTKAELIEHNNKSIEASIDEVKEEFIKDFEKELKKIFK